MNYIIDFAAFLENWIPYPGVTKVLSFLSVMIVGIFAIMILFEVLDAIKKRSAVGLGTAIHRHIGAAIAFVFLIIVVSMVIAALVKLFG